MKNWQLLILALATGLIFMLMRPSGQKLVTDHTPAGIINLELARTKTNVKNILNLWRMQDGEKVDRIRSARVNIYWDFLFILGYAALLYFGAKRTATQFYKRSTWAHWGNNLGIAAILAAGFDVLENVGMLISLNNQVSSGLVKFTFSVSLIKWILIGLILLYMLISQPLKIFQKKRMKTA